MRPLRPRAAAAPCDDGPDPIDVGSAHQQAVALDDPQNRVDARGVTGDQLDTDAGRPAGLGDDLGLEPIFADGNRDRAGSHTAIVTRAVPVGPRARRGGQSGLLCPAPRLCPEGCGGEVGGPEAPRLLRLPVRGPVGLTIGGRYG